MVWFLRENSTSFYQWCCVHLWKVKLYGFLQSFLSGWQTINMESQDAQVWIKQTNASEFIVCIGE